MTSMLKWLLGSGWTADKMPSLAGKVAIVTGANAGIGFEITVELVRKGCKVVMACRSLERGLRAAQEIREERHIYADLEVMQCDLGSLRCVEQFAEAFKAKNLPLHILVNNAMEAMRPPGHSEDGFERTLAVNYFGHFYLTHLLLDVLKDTAADAVAAASAAAAAAAAAGAGPAARAPVGPAVGVVRVVNMASAAEQYGTIDWEDISSKRSTSSGPGWYCTSKLYMLMFTTELAKRLKGTGVEVFAVHPGLIATNAGKHAAVSHYPFIGLLSYILWTYVLPVTGPAPWRGAAPALYAATAPELTGHSGEFLGALYIGPLELNLARQQRRVPLNRWARNPFAAKKLYEETVELIQAARSSASPAAAGEHAATPGQPLPPTQT